MPKNWRFRESPPPPLALETWAEELGVSPLLARLLWARGFTDQGAMDRYLSPNLRHMTTPESFPGLTKAAETLARALGELAASGKRPAVWGDYDVDGVTASALCVQFLRSRGFDPLHHLPVRGEEGYGLNVAGVEKLAEEGAGLLITVDCGVTDYVPVARAKELGMTVVVTDHHLPPDNPEDIPPADALVDPRVGECGCEELLDLAGVGVAFYLMAALNRLLDGEPADMREYLDLVALGTLADVVSLTNLNRILAKNGMLMLAEARRPGIAALKEAAGFAPAATLGAGQVTFGLAPRINAAGRMGKAGTAYELLMAPDLETARPLAAELEEMNRARRSEEDAILQQALDQATEQAHHHGLVLYGSDWHSGVIGIVASRVVEAHYKPTLILCDENGLIKGSGRSIKEFDLHAGLQECSHVLHGFGGHKQAAGLSIEPLQLAPLREAFDAAVVKQIGETPLSPSLTLDAELPLRDVDFILLKELEIMQPFGMGNPEPVFASPPVTAKNYRIFGRNHVSMDLTDTSSGAVLRAKVWRQADNLRPEHVAGPFRVAFTPKLDRYNGLASIDLRIADWNLHAEGPDSP